MRVSNDRLQRDLRTIDLAQRMLRHRARTLTISTWTGLTGDRVRTLAKSHGVAERSQRGPSPTQFNVLMESPALRQEAAAVAGLCRWLEVIPAQLCDNPRRTLPSLARGEKLCYAFERFPEITPHPRLTFEQWVLLVLTFAAAGSWAIDWCTNCNATILVDGLAASRRLCSHCSPRGRRRKATTEEDLGVATLERPASEGSSIQGTLF